MKIGLKVVSTVTLVCFLTTQCVWGAPAAGIEMAAGRELPAYLSIDVPADLGTVDALYEAPAGASPQFILHIQNAHANYQAQMKIKQLLGYMNKKYGFRTIFVEGASEKLDADYLRLFPDRERNLKLCDELAKQGELTGAELFLMEQATDSSKKSLGPKSGDQAAVEALGIEEASLYKANYEALQKVFGADADVTRFFKGFDGKLDKVASKTFTPETRELIAEWKRFEQGRREFMPFVKGLASKSKKILKVDIESLFAQVGWPQISRLLVIQQMEKDLNKAKGVEEQAALIKMLRTKRVSKELLATLENFSEGSIAVGRSTTEVSPREVLERLAAEAGPQGFKFSDYPAFSLYAGYVTLRAELDPKILFDEIEYLFTEMLDASAEKPGQKALLALYRDGELLRKLLHLELNRAQWRQAVETKDRIGVPSLVARLKDAVIASGDTTVQKDQQVMPKAFSGKMDELFTAGFEFYDYAHKRESVFYKEMKTAMTEHKITKAILITGGFHTDGMSDLFRENAISYGIVTPRLSEKSDENLYQRMMLQDYKYPFEIANLEMIVRGAQSLLAVVRQGGRAVDYAASRIGAMMRMNVTFAEAGQTLNAFLNRLAEPGTPRFAYATVNGRSEIRMVEPSSVTAPRIELTRDVLGPIQAVGGSLLDLNAARPGTGVTEVPGAVAKGRSEMRKLLAMALVSGFLSLPSTTLGQETNFVSTLGIERAGLNRAVVSATVDKLTTTNFTSLPIDLQWGAVNAMTNAESIYRGPMTEPSMIFVKFIRTTNTFNFYVLNVKEAEAQRSAMGKMAGAGAAMSTPTPGEWVSLPLGATGQNMPVFFADATEVTVGIPDKKGQTEVIVTYADRPQELFQWNSVAKKLTFVSRSEMRKLLAMALVSGFLSLPSTTLGQETNFVSWLGIERAGLNRAVVSVNVDKLTTNTFTKLPIDLQSGVLNAIWNNQTIYNGPMTEPNMLFVKFITTTNTMNVYRVNIKEAEAQRGAMGKMAAPKPTPGQTVALPLEQAGQNMPVFFADATEVTVGIPDKKGRTEVIVTYADRPSELFRWNSVAKKLTFVSRSEMRKLLAMALVSGFLSLPSTTLGQETNFVSTLGIERAGLNRAVVSATVDKLTTTNFTSLPIDLQWGAVNAMTNAESIYRGPMTEPSMIFVKFIRTTNTFNFYVLNVKEAEAQRSAMGKMAGAGAAMSTPTPGEWVSLPLGATGQNMPVFFADATDVKVETPDEKGLTEVIVTYADRPQELFQWNSVAKKLTFVPRSEARTPRWVFPAVLAAFLSGGIYFAEKTADLHERLMAPWTYRQKDPLTHLIDKFSAQKQPTRYEWGRAFEDAQKPWGNSDRMEMFLKLFLRANSWAVAHNYDARQRFVSTARHLGNSSVSWPDAWNAMDEILRVKYGDGIFIQVGTPGPIDEILSDPAGRRAFYDARGDKRSMEAFVRVFFKQNRYILKQEVSFDDWVAGFAPWYSAPDHDGRSFEEFEDEINRLVGQGILEQVPEIFPSGLYRRSELRRKDITPLPAGIADMGIEGGFQKFSFVVSAELAGRSVADFLSLPVYREAVRQRTGLNATEYRDLEVTNGGGNVPQALMSLVQVQPNQTLVAQYVARSEARAMPRALSKTQLESVIEAVRSAIRELPDNVNYLIPSLSSDGQQVELRDSTKPDAQPPLVLAADRVLALKLDGDGHLYLSYLLTDGVGHVFGYQTIELSPDLQLKELATAEGTGWWNQIPENYIVSVRDLPKTVLADTNFRKLALFERVESDIFNLALAAGGLIGLVTMIQVIELQLFSPGAVIWGVLASLVTGFPSFFLSRMGLRVLWQTLNRPVAAPREAAPITRDQIVRNVDQYRISWKDVLASEAFFTAKGYFGASGRRDELTDPDFAFRLKLLQQQDLSLTGYLSDFKNELSDPYKLETFQRMISRAMLHKMGVLNLGLRVVSYVSPTLGGRDVFVAAMGEGLAGGERQARLDYATVVADMDQFREELSDLKAFLKQQSPDLVPEELKGKVESLSLPDARRWAALAQTYADIMTGWDGEQIFQGLTFGQLRETKVVEGNLRLDYPDQNPDLVAFRNRLFAATSLPDETPFRELLVNETNDANEAAYLLFLAIRTSLVKLQKLSVDDPLSGLATYENPEGRKIALSFGETDLAQVMRDIAVFQGTTARSGARVLIADDRDMGMPADNPFTIKWGVASGTPFLKPEFKNEFDQWLPRFNGELTRQKPAQTTQRELENLLRTLVGIGGKYTNGGAILEDQIRQVVQLDPSDTAGTLARLKQATAFLEAAARSESRMLSDAQRKTIGTLAFEYGVETVRVLINRINQLALSAGQKPEFINGKVNLSAAEIAKIQAEMENSGLWDQIEVLRGYVDSRTLPLEARAIMQFQADLQRIIHNTALPDSHWMNELIRANGKIDELILRLRNVEFIFMDGNVRQKEINAILAENLPAITAILTNVRLSNATSAPDAGLSQQFPVIMSIISGLQTVLPPTAGKPARSEVRVNREVITEENMLLPGFFMPGDRIDGYKTSAYHTEPGDYYVVIDGTVSGGTIEVARMNKAGVEQSKSFLPIGYLREAYNKAPCTITRRSETRSGKFQIGNGLTVTPVTKGLLVDDGNGNRFTAKSAGSLSFELKARGVLGVDPSGDFIRIDGRTFKLTETDGIRAALLRTVLESEGGLDLGQQFDNFVGSLKSLQEQDPGASRLLAKLQERLSVREYQPLFRNLNFQSSVTNGDLGKVVYRITKLKASENKDVLRQLFKLAGEVQLLNEDGSLSRSEMRAITFTTTATPPIKEALKNVVSEFKKIGSTIPEWTGKSEKYGAYWADHNADWRMLRVYELSARIFQKASQDNVYVDVFPELQKVIPKDLFDPYIEAVLGWLEQVHKARISGKSAAIKPADDMVRDWYQQHPDVPLPQIYSKIKQTALLETILTLMNDQLPVEERRESLGMLRLVQAGLGGIEDGSEEQLTLPLLAKFVYTPASKDPKTAAFEKEALQRLAQLGLPAAMQELRARSETRREDRLGTVPPSNAEALILSMADQIGDSSTVPPSNAEALTLAAARAIRGEYYGGPQKEISAQRARATEEPNLQKRIEKLDRQIRSLRLPSGFVRLEVDRTGSLRAIVTGERKSKSIENPIMVSVEGDLIVVANSYGRVFEINSRGTIKSRSEARDVILRVDSVENVIKWAESSGQPKLQSWMAGLQREMGTHRLTPSDMIVVFANQGAPSWMKITDNRQPAADLNLDQKEPAFTGPLSMIQTKIAELQREAFRNRLENHYGLNQIDSIVAYVLRNLPAAAQDNGLDWVITRIPEKANLKNFHYELAVAQQKPLGEIFATRSEARISVADAVRQVKAQQEKLPTGAVQARESLPNYYADMGKPQADFGTRATDFAHERSFDVLSEGAEPLAVARNILTLRQLINGKMTDSSKPQLEPILTGLLSVEEQLRRSEARGVFLDFEKSLTEALKSWPKKMTDDEAVSHVVKFLEGFFRGRTDEPNSLEDLTAVITGMHRHSNDQQVWESDGAFYLTLAVPPGGYDAHFPLFYFTEGGFVPGFTQNDKRKNRNTFDAIPRFLAALEYDLQGLHFWDIDAFLPRDPAAKGDAQAVTLDRLSIQDILGALQREGFRDITTADGRRAIGEFLQKVARVVQEPAQTPAGIGAPRDMFDIATEINIREALAREGFADLKTEAGRRAAGEFLAKLAAEFQKPTRSEARKILESDARQQLIAQILRIVTNAEQDARDRAERGELIGNILGVIGGYYYTVFTSVDPRDGLIQVVSVLPEDSPFRTQLTAFLDQAAAPRPMERKRILIAEGNADLRGIYLAILRDKGYEVEGFGDGREAFQRLEAANVAGTPFDLLITSGELTGLDGLGLLDRVKAYPNVQRLLVSGGIPGIDYLATLGVPYLDKPVTRDVFLDKVAGLLKPRSELRSTAAMRQVFARNVEKILADNPEVLAWLKQNRPRSGTDSLANVLWGIITRVDAEQLGEKKVAEILVAYVGSMVKGKLSMEKFLANIKPIIEGQAALQVSSKSALLIKEVNKIPGDAELAALAIQLAMNTGQRVLFVLDEGLKKNVSAWKNFESSVSDIEKISDAGNKLIGKRISFEAAKLKDMDGAANRSASAFKVGVQPGDYVAILVAESARAKSLVANAATYGAVIDVSDENRDGLEAAQNLAGMKASQSNLKSSMDPAAELTKEFPDVFKKRGSYFVMDNNALLAVARLLSDIMARAAVSVSA